MRSNKRKAPAADRRLAKAASARDAIAGLGPDMEIDVLTFGQFSFADLVEAALDYTGPADVIYATWTAAGADVSRARQQLMDGRLRSLRFIVDRSFLTRQPEYAATLLELFGPGAIRSTRLHAKFALLRGDDLAVTIRTSMNLNTNPRLEYAQVSTCPDLFTWWSRVVDDIWAEAAPGLDGAAKLPSLPSLRDVTPSRRIEVGRG